MNKKPMIVFLAVSFFLGFLTACSTQRTKTVTTETTQYSDESNAGFRGDPAVVERQTTKETETTSGSESGGLVSGTVNAVGEIIALPFHAVGGLVRLIF